MLNYKICCVYCIICCNIFTIFEFYLLRKKYLSTRRLESFIMKKKKYIYNLIPNFEKLNNLIGAWLHKIIKS